MKQLIISINNYLLYSIGVYTFDKVKFSIQINIGKLHFYQLKKGIPMNFFAEYNSFTYLNYYHA